MVRFGLGMNFRFYNLKVMLDTLSLNPNPNLIGQIMLPTRQIDAVGATWIDA